MRVKTKMIRFLVSDKEARISKGKYPTMPLHIWTVALVLSRSKGGVTASHYLKSKGIIEDYKMFWDLIAEYNIGSYSLYSKTDKLPT